MSGITWLLAASLIIWIGLAAYTAFIAARQRDISRRLAALEQDGHD